GRPGGPVRLTVERDGARHDIVVTPRAGLNPRWPSAVPLWLSIALSWTVVALLLWSRPGDHQVVRISPVAGIGLAGVSLRNPLAGWAGEQARIAWVTIFILLSGVMCAQFLHFCARYPVWVTLPRWVLPVAYGLPAGLTALSLVVFHNCLRQGTFVP